MGEARGLALVAVTTAAAVVVWLAALALAAAPAAADTCPDRESVLPGKGDDPDPPYQCAQMNSSDNKKLSAWETKSWSSSPGAGYYNKTTCKYKDNKNVDITGVDAGSGLGSYTATATNWDVDKSHHFAAGVLWATGNVEDAGYSSGCADDNEDGDIEHSILNLTSIDLTSVPSTATVGTATSVTATFNKDDAWGYVVLLANDSPGAVKYFQNGSATISWTPMEAGSTTVQVAFDFSNGYLDDHQYFCPTTDHTCGWSAGVSDGKTVEVAAASSSSLAKRAAPSLLEPVDVSGLTGDVVGPFGAAAKPKTVGLTTKTKAARMPGHLSLSCKDGQMPMYAEAITRGSGNPRVRYGNSGARVVGSKALRGQHVTLQLSCRNRNAKLLGQPQLLLGTKRDDTVKTRRSKMGVFAGPGADRVSVASKGSFAHGGLHADRMTVKAASGVATGDAGRDTLEAKTKSRTLLVGGEDADRLIGSKGRTLINAADGSGGDRVICNGRGNKVLADRGDTVRGPCGVVRRVKG